MRADAPRRKTAGNRPVPIGALTEALRESRELSFAPYDAVQTALAGHRAIVEALRAHDPDKARRAMRRHLDEVERLIRASLTQAGRG